MTLHRLALACCLAAGLAAAALATQTAFWRPYEADAQTHLLLRFAPPDPVQALGETGKAAMTGDAAAAPEGRFGGALRLGGKGGLKVEPQKPYLGGTVAIEAWLKLERYPDKTAYVVYRPAVVDSDARYDPKVDKTKGFGLFIDAQGALHLETTNLFYGKRTVTSSPPGAVPLGKWVHVAGISAVYRRLYVDGREVASVGIQWGEGLAVHGDEEAEPGPLFIGNNAAGDAGLVGLLDEVRVHRNVFRLWEREDTAWTRRTATWPVPISEPLFLTGHQPAVYLPLDETLVPMYGPPELKVGGAKARFVEGVRNQGVLGGLSLSAPGLLRLDEGSLEFWFQPYGVNNWSDRNRGFVSTGAFTLYIFNGGDPGRPVSLYYANPQGGLEFLSVEDYFYEGRWRHAVITWRGREVCLYMDGRRVARSTAASLATPGNKGVSDTIQFGEAIVDEVFVYRRALLPEEVANAYWRYRDPAKLNRDVRLDPVEIEGLFFPSTRMLYYRLIPNIEPATIQQVTLTLRSPEGKELLRKKVPFSAEASSLELPRLGEGPHSLGASVIDRAGKTNEGGAFTFDRKVFPWEGNDLGDTVQPYPPFTHVGVRGQEVAVVGRTHRMNGFGLWESVVVGGRELLAAPMSLRYWVRGAEGKWEKVGGRVTGSKKRNIGVSEATAAAPAVKITTRSFVEMDGCMRVEMTLSPGPKPEEIERLWLDIPLKASEARLLHETTDTLRQNFAGAVPEGQGVVWDSRKGHRGKSWRNAFTAYIWLGNPNRGLAWFAENDKGWVTRKDHKEALQEIIREGDKVILRVHLINQPITLKEPRTIVFGLQASPTKPMPEGWRARLPDMPTGLAVVPFGGLCCSYQTPYRNDWAIADKIAEARATGKVDAAWFAAYDKQHNPPPAHGTWPWLGSVMHFAGRAKDVGPNRPLTVYQEEMAACTARDEWKTFADEWAVEPFAFRRGPLTEPDESIFRGGRNTGPCATVNFGRSYQDFGCYVANEWLRRGMSLYWDNTYPRSSMNPLNSAAYVTEDGTIQPAVLLWNQREYQKRVWNLLQEWRKKRSEPLEWVNHMTNTLVLPIHTWATANLDHELGSAKPFSPEWLQAETIGLQTGNYPLTLYPVTGNANKVFDRAKPPEGGTTSDLQYRAEWGMRMVHEIQSNGGKLYDLVRQFGYGTDAVTVHNYWADEPVLSVEPSQVKWLVLAKPAAREALIILASWAADPVKAAVRFDPKRLGIPGAYAVTDVEAKGEPGVDRAAVDLPGPYGVRMVRVWSAAVE